MNNQIAEISSDYVDDANYRHIDVWKTKDENEEGKTVAIFCEDTGKSFITDNNYQTDILVKETLAVIKQDWLIINDKYTFSMGDISITGEIDALKDFVVEINDGLEGELLEYSNNICDGVFDIESKYQTIHNLDQDNFEKVH